MERANKTSMKRFVRVRVVSWMFYLLFLPSDYQNQRKTFTALQFADQKNYTGNQHDSVKFLLMNTSVCIWMIFRGEKPCSPNSHSASAKGCEQMKRPVKNRRCHRPGCQSEKTFQKRHINSFFRDS